MAGSPPLRRSMRQQHRQVGGRLRKLSPMFAPCELRRLVTDMLREAGKPLATRAWRWVHSEPRAPGFQIGGP